MVPVVQGLWCSRTCVLCSVSCVGLLVSVLCGVFETERAYS